MNLYIRIKDGVPFEHPILEDNFKEAFPNIDVNNLPPEFAKFIRIQPSIKPEFYSVLVNTYQFVDNIVQDVWSTRSMTEQEKTNKNTSVSIGINKNLQSLKIIAEDTIKNADTDQMKTIWTEYLNHLNSYVLTNFEKPDLPMPPRKGSDGIWVSTLSKGTAPNVIQ